MAKKKELTPEEKLQQALVPKEEQPYPLPEGWKWVRLIDSFENCTDSKRKIAKEDYLEKGDIAIIDQGKALVGGYTDITEKKYKGTLPVIIFGDHTRCIKYIDFPFAQGADGIKVLKPKKFFLPKAFYFVFQNIPIPDMGYRRHFPLLKQYMIPVPPIGEQQRIIEKIEKWFYKLDIVQEKIKDVIASSEKRKAAILHKAFTGELTTKWRRENNISNESWIYKAINNICKFQYGTSKKSQKEGKMIVLRMGNLQNGEIDWTNLAYTSDEADIKKYLLKQGDVLFNRTNSPELVGKTAIYRGEYPAIYAGYLIKLEYNSEILGEYLNYVLNSPDAREYCYFVKSDGVSQSNINAQKIGEFIIPIPSIKEQEVIIREIHKIFTMEFQIKRISEELIFRIDVMKKAILSKAFHGEYK